MLGFQRVITSICVAYLSSNRSYTRGGHESKASLYLKRNASRPDAQGRDDEDDKDENRQLKPKDLAPEYLDDYIRNAKLYSGSSAGSGSSRPPKRGRSPPRKPATHDDNDDPHPSKKSKGTSERSPSPIRMPPEPTHCDNRLADKVVAKEKARDKELGASRDKASAPKPGTSKEGGMSRAKELAREKAKAKQVPIEREREKERAAQNGKGKGKGKEKADAANLDDSDDEPARTKTLVHKRKVIEDTPDSTPTPKKKSKDDNAPPAGSSNPAGLDVDIGLPVESEQAPKAKEKSRPKPKMKPKPKDNGKGKRPEESDELFRLGTGAQRQADDGDKDGDNGKEAGEGAEGEGDKDQADAEDRPEVDIPGATSSSVRPKQFTQTTEELVKAGKARAVGTMTLKKKTNVPPLDRELRRR